MQNVWNHQVVQGRVVPFPSKDVRVRTESDVRTRFERGLIFVLLSLWAIGMVAWTLVTFVGVGYGTGPQGLASIQAPSSLPTLQSATVFAVRLLLGW